MKTAVAFALILLSAACAPSKRDNRYYEQMKAMKPSEFYHAKEVFSWRSFTGESDGSASRQCAIVIYDVEGSDVASFMRRTRMVWNRDGVDTESWQIGGDTEKPIQLPHSLGNRGGEYVPFSDARSFCFMKEKTFASFAAKVNRVWRTRDARLMIREGGDGGGTAFDMSEPSRFVAGAAFDPRTKRLYMWLQAYPHFDG